MSKLRLLIKSLLREMIEDKRGHFSQRVFDKLQSDHTTFPGKYTDFEKKVMDAIAFLRQIEVKTQVNMGISFVCPNVFTYKDDSKESGSSSGDKLWIVSQGNVLETVMFGSGNYIPRSVRDVNSIVISYEDFYNYFAKKGNLTIDIEDEDKLRNYGRNKNKVVNPQRIEQIVPINGVKWVVEGEILRMRNNPKVSHNVFDALDGKIEGLVLSEETKKLIWSILESQE